MNRHIGFAGVIFCAVLVGCAATVPVEDVKNHPVTNLKKMTLDDVRKGIVLGGARYKWVFEVVGPGQLRATQDEGKFSAVISITYTETSYNITLLESSGLEQKTDRIRSRYNRWIQLLTRSIDAELTKVAVSAL